MARRAFPGYWSRKCNIWKHVRVPNIPLPTEAMRSEPIRILLGMARPFPADSRCPHATQGGSGTTLDA